MSRHGDRTEEIRALMRERILVLDGATGTMLQSRGLAADDFGGAELDGCNEHLVVTRPDVILDVHRAYLEAGADLIETDTFGGAPVVLAEYGLAARARELNRRAAELAVQAAAEFATQKKPRFVVGSIGPTTRVISVTGGITFAELVAGFSEQALGLLEGGVDLFFVETCQDTRNTKAALVAVRDALAATGVVRPVVVSGTIEPTGTMLAGQTAEAFVASLDHVDLLAVGLNCATGPEFMTDHLRSVHEMATCAVSCYPNAGLPDEDGRYRETPERLARALERFADLGWLNIVGGCCGTDANHVAAIAAMVEGKAPRTVAADGQARVFYSGIDLVEATDENRPLLVGERTNVLGSKKFRRLVGEERWEEATEIASLQVRNGAQIVDVCLTATDSDELADADAFYARLIRAVKAPLMIDTTDPEVVELALSYSQGKAIVNSINLEDGEGRPARICRLLKRYGGAVVVGTIDEDPDDAQAFTRERKLEIARRSHRLLTTINGLEDRDLIFDPLVFPTASGDAGYVGGAVETIEGLRAIKQEFPGCRTILGISNVSFGLPTAAREVVNSVFLYHCTLAGLDLAIVNTERLERFASIPEDERNMAEGLLFNRPPCELPANHPDADLLALAPGDWRKQTHEQRVAINRFQVARLTEHFRGAVREREQASSLPLDERLARYVIEGTRDGLIDDLDRKLGEGTSPLAIINGPLMDGMTEVGRLFNANQLIVAEVLRSAESMKAAVTHLEQHMEAEEAEPRATVVLATVKGDVHDIGKNLVEILLKNNGFEVVDLGIKVPPERLVAACREHAPDAIGLSGLLVRSAQQMVVTVEDLRAAAIDTPILVGGAALSQGFTESRIAPAYGGPVVYCADAMKGLDAMRRLADPARRRELGRITKRRTRNNGTTLTPAVERDRGSRRSSTVDVDVPPRPAPETERRVLAAVPDLREVWSYINPRMLFGKHLGLRGDFGRLLAERDGKALELHDAVEEVQSDAEGWMRVAAVWRFFAAESAGNELRLFTPDGELAHCFVFPRQAVEDGLCLADYVVPPHKSVRDSVAVFVVSAGEGVRKRASEAKGAGAYLRSHVIQAVAIETAEGAAEWLHRRIRDAWGFPDPPELTMKDRFAARYQGKRYSFGYPACPNLDDQQGIWKLLRPEEIGVHLTDGMMMDPEASVSALVFHHPDCTYFSASGTKR